MSEREGWAWLRNAREQWEAIQRREKCDRAGHEYRIVVHHNAPQTIKCDRCGKEWDVRY